MKKSRYLPALTLGFGITLLWLSGCDSDDNAINPQPSASSGTDSTLVSDAVGDRLLATPFQSLGISTELLSQQGVTSSAPRSGPLAATGNGDEHIVITAIGNYQFADGWHVFEFEAIVVNTTTADTVDISGIDSVQVLVNGQPVVTVDEGEFVDGLRARAHVDWSARAGQGDGAVHHSIDVGAAPIESDTLVTIDGFAHDTLNGFETTDSTDCELHLTYDMTIDNLQMYASSDDDDCPEAGDISVAVGIDASCVETQTNNPDSVHVNGTWTVTAHVNGDGTVTITFSNGIIYWQATEPCGSEPTNVNQGWWTTAVSSQQSYR